MDRIVLGDNQFFGINHMSEEKARDQAMRFAHTRAIMDVLDVAYDLGIRTLMCTTHDRIGEVCEAIRAKPSRYPDFQFYPCMPYAHKYANAAGQLGMLGALKKFAPNTMLDTIVKGAVSALRRDLYGLMQLLVDAEMRPFAGLATKVVFLQNVVTDLLLGLDFKAMFIAFADHIRQRYNAEAGFITMNLPRLLDTLDACGIVNPIVCSSINKIGFRMCGGVEAYEGALATRTFRPLAMSVFASGAIPPAEALAYVCGQKKITSIVFGASTEAHIRQTKELIERLG
jgi:hypothetical protein